MFRQILQKVFNVRKLFLASILRHGILHFEFKVLCIRRYFKFLLEVMTLFGSAQFCKYDAPTMYPNGGFTVFKSENC